MASGAFFIISFISFPNHSFIEVITAKKELKSNQKKKYPIRAAVSANHLTAFAGNFFRMARLFAFTP